MKTMLIVTGPQGSGNHVFSKVFALHKQVYGWKELLNQYWIAHDHEPFASCWNNPEELKLMNFDSMDYYVTSISCPYANKGVVTIPNYEKFVNTLKELGIQVKVAIIGRDQNILKHQQLRVRERHSYVDFEKQLPYLLSLNPTFISQELLYLYKQDYLKTLSEQLNFPIDYQNDKIKEILKKDANSKYFVQIEKTELDLLARHVSGLGD